MACAETSIDTGYASKSPGHNHFAISVVQSVDPRDTCVRNFRSRQACHKARRQAGDSANVASTSHLPNHEWTQKGIVPMAVKLQQEVVYTQRCSMNKLEAEFLVTSDPIRS